MNDAVRAELLRLAGQEQIDSQSLKSMLQHRPGPPPEVYTAMAALLRHMHQSQEAYR